VKSPRLHYAWVTVVLAVLVVFASLGLGRFAYSAVLPAMQAGLGFDNTAAGALASANLVGYLALAALSGALASQIGPRRVIAAGLALVGVGLLGTGLARTYPEALLWRVVTGAGSGASNVPAMGLLAAWFAPRRRGFAAGIGVAGSSVALILVGPLCPALVAAGGAAGWRWCWFLFGALALAVAALVASALLFGFTAWSVPAIMAAACGDLLGPRLAPAALGFITLFFGVGQALGPAVAGYLADARGSFAPGYLTGAVAMLAGAAGALALRDRRAQS